MMEHAQAQPPGKLVRIGVLMAEPFQPLQSLRQELHRLGYVEGQNLRFEYRFAEHRDDQYPALANELAALGVDLIVTFGTPATLAAKHATKTIPIVIGGIAEAVGTGVVSNLARPGENVTGFTSLGFDLESKRLELLKELVLITGHWSRPRNRTSCSCSSVVAGGSTAQIGTLLDAFTPAECHPYLVNSGSEFV